MSTTTEGRKAKVTPQGDTQILIERWFDAPARLLWEAWTEAARPALVDGQAWLRHDMRDRLPHRRQVALRDARRQHRRRGRLPRRVPRDRALERIVSTEACEGIPGCDEHASTNTLTLTETDGRKHLRVLIEHKHRWGRDMHLESGMADGRQDALDLLEGVAQSLNGS